jgi:hypothetical protein
MLSGREVALEESDEGTGLHKISTRRLGKAALAIAC